VSYGAVRYAIHPCGKPQGILAKANKRLFFYTFHFGFQILVFLNQLVDIFGFCLVKVVQGLVVDIGHNMPP